MISEQRTGRNPANRFIGYGFTLVEVLVAIVIVGITAAMVLTATAGVNRSAREARTRSIIQAIDSVLRDQFEAFRYRPMPVEIPYMDPVEQSGSLYGFEVLGLEAARVRLIMRRDWQRMDFPDKQLDIVTAVGGTTAQTPVTIKAVANRTESNVSGVVTRDFSGKQKRNGGCVVSQQQARSLSPKSSIYWSRLERRL